MIREVTMYQAVCDGCGKPCTDGEITGWEAAERAHYVSMESGYKDIDGKLYCPDCYEYNEETDEYKLKIKED